jgi:hypothetical protein
VLINSTIEYDRSYYKERFGLDLFEQVPAILQRLVDRFNQKKSASNGADGLKFLSS